MRLSRQLLLVSLLVLVLPIAGVSWIQDLALTLREQQAQILNASLRATAASLALRDTLPNTILSEGAVYVHPLKGGLIIDGYFEDWKAQGLVSRAYGERVTSGNDIAPVLFNAASDGSNLYLAFQVNNDKKRNGSGAAYYSPVGKTLANGDRIQLSIKDKNGKLQQYVVTTEAPGPVVARTTTVWNGMTRIVRENRIRGVWREIPEGYQLELMMPQGMAGKQFGFRVIKGTDENWTGSEVSGSEPGILVLPDWALSESLSYFLEPEIRLGVVNNAGWQIADTGLPLKTDVANEDAPFWFLERLFRIILRWDSLPSYQAYWRDGGWQNSIVVKDTLDGVALNGSVLNATAHYRWLRDKDNFRLLSAWPLVRDNQVVGVLVAEQGSDALLAMTWKSLSRLFSLSFLVIVMAASGLLGYASWLSLRIRRLHKATEKCIGRDGRLRRNFPVSQSQDEVGELSRSINTMLFRLEEHTDYLRTLGSKLSHELRTPLAVVRSSLDNLEHEGLHPQAQVYAQRALAGADRLRGLLGSISEATRLESMIDDLADGEREIIDLKLILEDLYQAYSGVYPEQQFVLKLPGEPCPIALIPDLIVQAMDKLVSNAVDFCSESGQITLRLVQNLDSVFIEVENDGELLPDAMQESLFNSMVSVRKTRGNKAHLGLGLYIVRLVMACHNGIATAENRKNHSGVTFKLVFPK